MYPSDICTAAEELGRTPELANRLEELKKCLTSTSPRKRKAPEAPATPTLASVHISQFNGSNLQPATPPFSVQRRCCGRTDLHCAKCGAGCRTKGFGTVPGGFPVPDGATRGDYPHLSHTNNRLCKTDYNELTKSNKEKDGVLSMKRVRVSKNDRKTAEEVYSSNNLPPAANTRGFAAALESLTPTTQNRTLLSKRLPVVPFSTETEENVTVNQDMLCSLITVPVLRNPERMLLIGNSI